MRRDGMDAIRGILALVAIYVVVAICLCIVGIARAQTQPRPALIEVHDPVRGVYVTDGYAAHIIYDGAGLYVLMHTDADAIFRNSFEVSP